MHVVCLIWFYFFEHLCASCFQRTVAIFCEITLPYLIEFVFLSYPLNSPQERKKKKRLFT